MRSKSIREIQNAVVCCALCPRLVQWRRKTAEEKVARFKNWDYWGKPVPGFGDHNARLLIVGLAPASHGANRTGRMFTGDRSGEWLYRSLYKFGFASKAESVSRDDDMELFDCYITAALRCAPPLNKPMKTELLRCEPYLSDEFRSLKNIRIIVGLGKIACNSVVDTLRRMGMIAKEKRPPFKHGFEVLLSERLTLIESYHPSQQNTFTGKLTMPMFDAIFQRTKKLLSA